MSSSERHDGMVLPHDLDAEESLLGAMMTSKDAIPFAADNLTGEDFYKTAHKLVFGAVVELYNSEEPVNTVTVADRLRRQGFLDTVGGAVALGEMVHKCPSIGGAKKYAKIVADLSSLRRAISVGQDIQKVASTIPPDVGVTLDDFERMVGSIPRPISDSLFDGEVLAEEFEEYLADVRSGVKSRYLSTGFQALDRQLGGGLHAGRLYVLAARPGMGKCLRGSSLVYDPVSGERVRMDELVKRGENGETVHVASLGDDFRLRPVRVSEFVRNGVKPVFTLTTRLGRVTTATGNHPFLTFEGWKDLSELRPGERVAVPRALPWFGGHEMPDEEVALLAYLIGDGGLTGGTPRLITESAEVLADATQHASLMGVTVKPVKSAECHYGLSTPRGLPNPVTDLCKRHGLWGLKSGEKFVPDDVFRLGRRQLALFLNRLFSTDGHASDSPTNIHIGYTSTSRRLIDDVVHLLLRFGIVANVRWLDRSDYDGTERGAWEARITCGDAILRFASEIGALSRQEAIDRVVAVVSAKERNTNVDTVPGTVWDLIEPAMNGMRLAELSERTGRQRNHNWHRRQRGMSRNVLGQIAEATGSQHLRDLAASDVFWDEVVSVEAAGEEETYDICVPPTHNFVADDIVVHNTSLAMNIGALSAMVYAEPVYVASMEMSSLDLTQRIIASESRVSTARLEEGALDENQEHQLHEAIRLLRAAPLVIDYVPGALPGTIREGARRVRAKYGRLGMVVVDYLQLMTLPNAESHQVAVAQASKSMKQLSQELECPVIVLSQLNRQVEQRNDKRPVLSDLRDSGCLTADTLISRSDDGRLVRMGDLLESGERDIPVWTLDESFKVVPGVMTHVFPSGVKDTFRLRLASGREVVGSGNHPFLTLDGWERLDSLSAGDRIAVARNVHEPLSPTVMDDDEVVLLAHMIGDGCGLARHSVQYTTEDPENAAAVTEAAWRLFGVEARVEPQIADGDWGQVFLTSPHRLTHGRRNPVAEWLDGLGLWDKRGPEKFVPEPVFGLDDRQVRLFLRHLWATDGCVSLSKGKDGGRQRVAAYYASSSERLARDVQYLLSRVGVLSTLRQVPPKKPAGNPGFQVWVTGATDQVRLFTEVGCHGARGRVAERCLKVLSDVKANPNSGTVPTSVWDYVRNKVMPAKGVTLRELARMEGRVYNDTAPFKASPSRERVARLGELFDDDYLRSLGESEVLWDRVVAVEPLGPQEVYDATVNETHNFIANGIVAHNSIEQDADVVMFIYRDGYYNAGSPTPTMAEILVAKNRFGSQDMVPLAWQADYSSFAEWTGEDGDVDSGGRQQYPPAFEDRPDAF